MVVAPHFLRSQKGSIKSMGSMQPLTRIALHEMKAYNSAQKLYLSFLVVSNFLCWERELTAQSFSQGRGAEPRMTDSSERHAGFPLLLSILGTVQRD